MNFKFSIGKKIGLGFGLLLFCTITIFLTTRLTLDSSKKINKHNTVTLSPSVDELQELKIQILESQMLITNWANVQTANEHPEKEKLRKLIRERYPILKEGIEKLSKDWSVDEVALAACMAQNTIPSSPAIKAQLEHYLTIVPPNQTAFIAQYDAIWTGKIGMSCGNPTYSWCWYENNYASWDETVAAQTVAAVEEIILKYFPETPTTTTSKFDHKL